MAKTPLRAYIKEIDQLIESSHIQEAIAHCKHILKFYPKHVDTYRLLGQAYLTVQRYGEATDVLRRVLVIIPDDFISQIGMSLIREDEGNLDAAIAHMEKAFEVFPSKAAIQEELKRLYGRRDGMVPPKIRLTRGALVRLYMKGELYQQAIAEVRTVLADDPQQPDLEVILAKLYYLSGQKVRAVEICSKLVNRLPYCLEANRILAEILPGTTRAEDAKIYRDRVIALDPYWAFLGEGMKESAEVPDAAVQIERLEYNPAAEEAEQPEWTRTAGVNWEGEAEEQAVPDWLSGETPTGGPTEENQPETTGEIQEEPQAEPAEIPDWMAAAGWSPANGEEQAPVSAMESAEDDQIAAPGEIPDWLHTLAPEGAPQPVVDDKVEDQAWLEKMLSGSDAAGRPAEVGSELPVDAAPEAAQSQLTLDEQQAIEPAQELPGWLQESAPASSETALQADALPEWLQEPASQQAESPAEAAEIPDWLEMDAEEVAPERQEATVIRLPDEPEESGEETGTQIVETLPAQPEEPVAAAPVPEDDLDSAMAWLEGLAARQGADEETLTTAPEARSDEMPDWVKQEEAPVSADVEQPLPQMAEIETAPALEAEAIIEAAPDVETPVEVSAGDGQSAEDENAGVPLAEGDVIAVEELPGQPAEEIVALPAEGVENPPESAGEILPPVELPGDQEDFSRQAGIETPEETLAAQMIEETASPDSQVKQQELPPEPEAVEIPDWLQEVEETAASAEVEASPVAEMSTPTEGQPSGEDVDDAMAWLEMLAARQGADEATLQVQPEARREEAPEWVANDVEVSPAAGIAAVEETVPHPAVEDTTPVEMPGGSGEVEPAAAEGYEEPETIKADSEAAPTEWQPEIEMEDKPATESSSAELPPWLREVEAIEEGERLYNHANSQDQEEETLPDWLHELEAMSEAPEPAVETSHSEWVPEMAAGAEPEAPEQLPIPAQKVEVPDVLEETLEPEPEETVAEQTTSGITQPIQLPPDKPAVDLSLAEAQTALQKGDVDTAVTRYNELIQSGQSLEEVIHDLREATDRYPMNTDIWQSLGDAYYRSNQIQEALNAFEKALELFR